MIACAVGGAVFGLGVWRFPDAGFKFFTIWALVRSCPPLSQAFDTVCLFRRCRRTVLQGAVSRSNVQPAAAWNTPGRAWFYKSLLVVSPGGKPFHSCGQRRGQIGVKEEFQAARTLMPCEHPRPQGSDRGCEKTQRLVYLSCLIIQKRWAPAKIFGQRAEGSPPGRSTLSCGPGRPKSLRTTAQPNRSSTNPCTYGRPNVAGRSPNVCGQRPAQIGILPDRGRHKLRAGDSPNRQIRGSRLRKRNKTYPDETA